MPWKEDEGAPAADEKCAVCGKVAVEPGTVIVTAAKDGMLSRVHIACDSPPAAPKAVKADAPKK